MGVKPTAQVIHHGPGEDAGILAGQNAEYRSRPPPLWPAPRSGCQATGRTFCAAEAQGPVITAQAHLAI